MLYVAGREFSINPFAGIGYMQLPETINREFGLTISVHGLIPGLVSEIGLLGGALVLLSVLACFHGLWRTASSAGTSTERLVCSHLVVSFVLLLFFGFFHQLVESPFFYLFAGLAFMKSVPNSEMLSRTAIG